MPPSRSRATTNTTTTPTLDPFTSPSISLPRTEHLTLPLSPTLRSQFSAHLIRSSTVKDVRKSMDRACHEVGWQQAVYERTMQLLREGEVREWKVLEGLLVREALGGEEKEEEEEEEEGMMGPDKQDDQGERRRKRKRKERGKTNVTIKVADIELPEKVKSEAWKIVRKGIDKADVSVREELTDGWVV